MRQTDGHDGPRFVNREDEHDALWDAFESDRAELLVRYGRRRLGETALVWEAIHDRDDVRLFTPADVIGR